MSDNNYLLSICFLVSVVLFCFAAATDTGARQQDISNVPYTPIEMRVHTPPVPIKGGGRTNLVYELHLSNFRRKPVLLSSIEIIGDGESLKYYREADLERCVLFRGQSDDSAKKLQLDAGSRAVLFVMLSFDKGARLPQTLRHSITAGIERPGGELVLLQSEGCEVGVDNTEPVVLGQPLRRGVWVAGNGTGDGPVGHRNSLQVWNGKLVITQRYAIDFMKFGDDLKLAHDDTADNANWYGYDEELLAVADEVVVDTIDGVIENIPLAGEYAVAPSLETAAGNCVILDIGGGHFAVYAHLKPGGVLVRVGDKVEKGQVIGLLGNSGISDAPHLHFHVGDAPSVFGGEALPFVFERFDYLGPFQLEDEDILIKAWPGGYKIIKRKEEIPVGDLVIRFPKSK